MKQITRSISMFLVCVMSLCLLTACGGGSGGGGNNGNSDSDFAYVRSLGCSASAQKEDNLEALANVTLSDFESYLNGSSSRLDYNVLLRNAGEQLSGKGVTYLGFSMELKAGGEKMLLYVDSNGNSFGPSESYGNNALSSYISNIQYYGAVQKTVTISGQSMYIAIAYFAR